MPRAADKYPSQRGADDTYSPLRGLLDYSALDQTVQDAGDNIKGVIDQISEDIETTVANTALAVQQILDIFAGVAVPDPVNEAVAALRDWWVALFGTGAPGDPIPAAQKGAANGVAPLDATAKVAVAYLPDLAQTKITGLVTRLESIEARLHTLDGL